MPLGPTPSSQHAGRTEPVEVDVPLEGLLAQRATETPERPVLLEGDRRCTYRDLDRRVADVAAGLAGRGVRPGERVAVLLGSSIDHVVAVFGLWRAGAVWVPFDPQVADGDLDYRADLTRPAILITDDEGRRRVEASGAPRLGAISVTDLSSLEAAPTGVVPGATLAGDAVIAFTSGTTGRPKGATITHRALRVHSMAAARHYSAGPDDRILTMLPLYLLSIFLVGPGLAVECGGLCRVVARYSPEEFIRLAALDRSTMMSAVPLFFSDLLELPSEDQERIDLSSFRIVTSGGALMPSEIRAAFESRFGFQFLNVFGGTEAPGLVSIDPLDGPPRLGSVGRAMPHIHICAIDDDWRELAPGEIGDLCTQPLDHGPFAGFYEPMRGYWGDPDQTAEVLSGRRLRWGDVGYVDEDGFVFLVDRAHDGINRGGMNIYPRQIERVAHEIPEVLEVAVVGRPHHRYGEVPVAFVRPVPGESLAPARILDYVNPRVPTYSRLEEVRVVEDMPRNALGKVLKRELRTRLHDDQRKGS